MAEMIWIGDDRCVFAGSRWSKICCWFVFAALYSMRACDLNSLEMSDGSFKMWSWSFEDSFFIASSSFRFNSFVLVPTVLICMFIFRITYTHITLSLYIYTCIILVKKYLKIILSNPCIQCIDATPRICRLAHSAFLAEVESDCTRSKP